MVPETTISPIDCACVIYGDVYPWEYVDRLYNMLTTNLSRPVRLHVYTESHRAVPAHMIKHSLIDWGNVGWWYKLQMFNPEFYSGPLLYFDLDTVIVNNIDWIWVHDLQYFWSIRDFKYLWKPTHSGLNSSVMWWNTQQFEYVWSKFKNQRISEITYRGDQDYISDTIPYDQRRFFNSSSVKSWRWQCLDGGYDFSTKKYLSPGTGTTIESDTSILICHGTPKPHETQDQTIVKFWK